MSYFSSTKSDYPDYKLFYIPITSPAQARNYAVNKCSGDYLFFLDDDCFLPDNYFKSIQLNSGWDAFGGPDRTPLDANSFEYSLGYALSSPLCMGKTYKRHSSESKSIIIDADESQLILCNLWFKRKLFTDEKFQFPINLFRNEENFLLKELKIQNKQIVYLPDMFVYHSRKSDLKSLAVTIARSGECRVKNFSQLPEIHEVIYFLPMIFLCFFLYWIFNPLSILGYGFIIYTISVVIYTLYKRQKKPMIIFLHYVIVVFYALGLVIGFKKLIESTFSKFFQRQIL